MRKWPTALTYAVPPLLTLIAVLQWFRPNTYIASGDLAPFVHDSIAAEILSLWGHDSTGAGSPTFTIAAAPEVLVERAASAIGLSSHWGQLLFYVLIAVGLVLAATYFCRSIEAARPAAALGGLFAFFNPFVLQSIPNALPLWTMMLLGMSGGQLIRVAKGRRVRGLWLGFVSLLAGYLAFNPPLLLTLILWVLFLASIGGLIGGQGGLERTVSFLLRSAPVCLLLSLWWALPLAFTLLNEGTGQALQAQTNVTAWSWTHARNSIPNVFSLSSSWAWADPEYFPYAASVDRPLWAMLRFGVPCLALLAPIVSNQRTRRATLPLAIGAVVLLALAKGLHEPLASVNLYLYNHVPGMWLLREPASKLAPMVVLIYSVLLAVTVGAACTWLRDRRTLFAGATFGAAVTVVVGGLVYPYPLWTGAVIPGERPLLPSAHVQIPPEWRRSATLLNTDPQPGKVLLLPLARYYQIPTIWGYYGTDAIPSRLLTRPSIRATPQAYLGQSSAFAAIVDAVEDALASQSTAAASMLLRSLGVSHIVLRKDIRVNFPGHSFRNPVEIDKGLRETSGVRLLHENALSKIYRVRTSHTGLIDAADSVLVASHSGDVLPAMIENAPTGSVVVSRHEGVSGDEGYVVSPGARQFRFHMPRRLADVRTSSTGPQLFSIKAIRDGPYRALRIRPAFRLTIDHQPLKPFRTVRVNVDRAGGALMVEGHLLTPRDGPVQVAIAPGHPLTVQGNRPRDSHVKLSPVADCNAYDSRNKEEVAIRAERLGAEPQAAVRLEAREHTACVSAPITSFRRGSAYRLQFDYRTVNGEKARFCLWQEGSNRCADLPVLERSPRWQGYDSTVALDPSTTGLQLFLYADGDGTEPTTIDFRAVRVRRWREVATWRPPSAATQRVDLAAGAHVFRSTGLLSSERPEFSPVGDCNAYDSRNKKEVGIRAERLGAEPQPAVRLEAREHTACVSAPITSSRGNAYRLQFDYRTVNGEKARFCLWQEGSNRCADLPPMERSSSWQRYDGTVTPDPSTTGLQLFLYADGDGTEPTTIDFRAVRVSYGSPYTVSILPRDDAPVAPRISWHQLSPTTYEADVSASSTPFLLVLKETFASGWTLREVPAQRSVRHLRVDGYANGWLVSPGDRMSVVIQYEPQALAYAAQGVSGLTVLLVPCLLWGRRRFGRIGRVPDGRFSSHPHLLQRTPAERARRATEQRFLDADRSKT